MNRSLMRILDWSVRVGSLFGVPISLHISLIFFLLPALASHSMGFGYAVEYSALIVLSILLHELGHALTAKHYRLTGLSIMLHGFGGFATSSGERTPKQSLMITLAGPAVTFAIAFLCMAIARFGETNVRLDGTGEYQFYLVGFVGSVNLIMGVLNLMPSLPFDGGSAVRALFWMRMSEFKARRATGHVGLIFSPIVLVYGWLTKHDFAFVFGIIGTTASLSILLSTGGIRFGEFVDDRKARKEAEELRKRDNARNVAYLSEVQARAKKREEEERLRRLLGE